MSDRSLIPKPFPLSQSEEPLQEQVRSISLCICTMNRPEELHRCLESVFHGTAHPDEVIVSDDSADGTPTQAVVANYPAVIYQSGPRRGLGANRNACIQQAKGSHIIFIDDDVCVPADFFAIAKQLIQTVEANVIISGYEMKHSDTVRKVVPHNADFWGLQRVPIQDRYCALVINATILPGCLFKSAQFDENLRYGCEEIDMARHAVALGYHILYQDTLYVNHYPSPVNREQYQQFAQASRLYATTKAYWWYDRSPLKTVTFILLAPLQLIGSMMRRRDLIGVWQSLQAIALASRYLYNQIQSQRS